MSTWIEALGTLLLGTVGLWAANNYRLGIRASLIERTAKAYSRLWEIMGNPNTMKPLNRQERKDLAEKLEAWYFLHGDGHFMPTQTRRLFFKVKNNLTAEPEMIEPTSLRPIFQNNRADLELIFACVTGRQFSLFRTQLKSDLTLHSMTPTFRALTPDESQLLKDCEIRPSRLALIVASLLGRSEAKLPIGSTSAPWCSCGHCPTLPHRPAR